MKRVTGLGGVFFKCRDPKEMQRWYGEHLGIDTSDYGASFHWRERENPEERGYTVWGTFSETTTYFAPSEKPYMLNYRVHDLDALLAALREEGVTIVGDVVNEPNGKFAWVMDPEGNKIELWQPVPSATDPYLG